VHDATSGSYYRRAAVLSTVREDQNT